MAMLSSSLILLSYFTSTQIEYYTDLEQVQLNVSSGMNLLLSSQSIIKTGEKKVLDLYGNNTDSVSIEKKSWGGFVVGITEGFSKHHRFRQIGMLGGGFSEDTTLSFYLEDQDKPLLLCGKTILKGSCLLPKAGIKRAYIEGQNFVGEKLVDGLVATSSNNMPPINLGSLSSITSLFLSRLNENDSVLLYEEVECPILSSFANNTLYIYSPNQIKITDKKISGNVVLISEKSISILTSSVLQDIIVYAPKVFVEDGFTGSLQIFASDTLMVGEACILNYPSVLGVIRTNLSVDNPALIIKEQSEISGIVFGYQEKFDNRKNISVTLEKNTVLTGHLYCNGLLDLKGSVYGSVLCKKLILKTPSAVYENHLLNAVIDRSKLPSYFVGFSLMHETPKLDIVKWLQ